MSLKIEEMQMGDELVLVDYKGLSEAWDLNEKVFNVLTVMDRLVFAGIDHKRTGGALIEGVSFAISKERLKFFKRKSNGLGDQEEDVPKIRSLLDLVDIIKAKGADSITVSSKTDDCIDEKEYVLLYQFYHMSNRLRHVVIANKNTLEIESMFKGFHEVDFDDLLECWDLSVEQERGRDE